VPGGPAVDSIAYLRAGRADFATAFLAGALAAGGKGAPLVDVCQVVNRSNLVLVARGDTVDDVDDLDGRRVSLWGSAFRAAFLALFKAAGVRPVLLPQYYTVNLFLRGGVVACVAMEYNEYHTIIQSGVDRRLLTTIALRGTRFDFPEDGVYTLAATQRRDPDLCRRFAAATIEGWRHCRDHPTAALRTVMRHARAAHVPTNRAHQRWMLEHILASIFPKRPGSWRPGVLDRADFERVCEIMIEQGQIARAPGYRRFVAPEARGAP